MANQGQAGHKQSAYKAFGVVILTTIILAVAAYILAGSLQGSAEIEGEFRKTMFRGRGHTAKFVLCLGVLLIAAKWMATIYLRLRNRGGR